MNLHVLNMTPLAKSFVMNNSKELEPCDAHGPHPKSEPSGEKIYGESPDHFIKLQRYPLKDGTNATEFLQKQVVDKDRMIYVIGLRLDSGYKITWDEKEIIPAVDTAIEKARQEKSIRNILRYFKMLRRGISTVSFSVQRIDEVGTKFGLRSNRGPKVLADLKKFETEISEYIKVVEENYELPPASGLEGLADALMEELDGIDFQMETTEEAAEEAAEEVTESVTR